MVKKFNDMKHLLNLQKNLFILIMLLAITMAFKSAREEYSYSQTVDTKNLKKIKAEIKFNAGLLQLTSHNQNMAEFNSIYTKINWKPDFKMDQESGRLSIHQPDEKNINMRDEDKNEWKIRIPKNLPTDLHLKMGAGEGTIDLNGSRLNILEVEAGAGKFDLNLANTSLSKLEVSTGVGALSIDLSGSKENDLTANIKGGIGEIKLVLPQKTGVRVKVNGLGSIERNDLKKQDGFYVNDLFGKTSKTVEVNIKGGLGSLEIVLQ
jgi:hypothetical protein